MISRFYIAEPLVPHSDIQTSAVTSPETVALKAFKALDLCPLTADF
jgi:hypothetical protein